jgi:RNA polymerase sigma-70 factor (ECF subfamily)
LGSLAANLEQIYRERRDQLFACALAVTRSPGQAEDAIHDAFCRLYTQKSPPRDLKAYVFRTVRNAAIDLVRRNQRSGEIAPELIFDPGPSPDKAAAEGEFRRRVAAALQELSSEECETILQHLYGGLTFREIAEIRDAPQGTIAGWYQRGLKKLRAKLEG